MTDIKASLTQIRDRLAASSNPDPALVAADLRSVRSSLEQTAYPSFVPYKIEDKHAVLADVNRDHGCSLSAVALPSVWNIDQATVSVSINRFGEIEYSKPFATVIAVDNSVSAVAIGDRIYTADVKLAKDREAAAEAIIKEALLAPDDATRKEDFAAAIETLSAQDRTLLSATARRFAGVYAVRAKNTTDADIKRSSFTTAKLLMQFSQSSA